MIRFIQRLWSRFRGTEPTHAIDVEAIRRITGEPVASLELYVQAMKHRSLLRGQSPDTNDSNERLEFLGDAVLGLVTAEYVFARFPEDDEGFLTRLRAKLVNARALATRATDVGLGELVLLSDNMRLSHGRTNVSILSDAMEALIGAVYLDQGAEAARRFVVRTLLDPLDLESLAHREDNYKSLLLEFAQARGWAQPRYQVIEEEGPAHDRRFTVQVILQDEAAGEGTGSSKKRAEQRAAAVALDRIRKAS